MTALAAPNPLNYTFGAHEVRVGAGGGVSLGNIVKAAVEFQSSPVSHFSAILGKEVEDPALLDLHSIKLSIELDEPNADNLKRWMMADSSFSIGMAPSVIDRLVFVGIPIVGNAFSWDIPRCHLRPSGSFGYSNDDWASFSLAGVVLYNKDTPTNPYGTLTHTGA